MRSRIVTDTEGRCWTVKEIPSAHVPGARGDFSLIFDTDMYCHRVWSYPDDWHALGDDDLLGLGRVQDIALIRERPRRAD